jgi:hypothetical protein
MILRTVILTLSLAASLLTIPSLSAASKQAKAGKKSIQLDLSGKFEALDSMESKGHSETNVYTRLDSNSLFLFAEQFGAGLQLSGTQYRSVDYRSGAVLAGPIVRFYLSSPNASSLIPYLTARSGYIIEKTDGYTKKDTISIAYGFDLGICAMLNQFVGFTFAVEHVITHSKSKVTDKDAYNTETGEPEIRKETKVLRDKASTVLFGLTTFL